MSPRPITQGAFWGFSRGTSTMGKRVFLLPTEYWFLKCNESN